MRDVSGKPTNQIGSIAALSALLPPQESNQDLPEQPPKPAQATPTGSRFEAEIQSDIPLPPSDEMTHAEMLELARTRVSAIINHLLLDAGIDVSRVVLPEVKVLADAATSSYCGRSNTIVIAPDHINSLSAYGEEIFHWLRHSLKPPGERADVLTDLPIREQYAVDEFFGFIGRSVVYELCKATALAPLDHSPTLGFCANTIDGHRKADEIVTRALTWWSKKDFDYVQTAAEYLNRLRDYLVENNLAAAAMCLDALECQVGEWRKEHGPTLQGSVPNNRCERLLLFAEMYYQNFPRSILRLDASNVPPHDPESSPNDTPGAHASWVKHLDLLISIFNRTISMWDSEVARLHSKQISNETHLPGYEAARRFLDRVPEPRNVIFRLLIEPSQKVYFSQIFQRQEPVGSRSFLSVACSILKEQYDLWVERRRLQSALSKDRIRLLLGEALSASSSKEQQECAGA